MKNLLWAVSVALVMGLAPDSSSFAQGLQASPYAAAPFLKRASLFAPYSPFESAHAQSPFLKKYESLLSENSCKKDIPNLQMGYEFYSGKNWQVGYFTLDYLLPIRLTENSIVFGAAHSEFQGSSTNLTSRADEQVFLSMGGGYRKVLGGKTLVGFNCYYDTARFANRWVTSGGAGLEIALLLAGHDALDMKFNWYGDLSEGDLINQYHDGPANFDLQFGYSHQLFDGGPDFRLFATVYDFDDKSGVLGWQTGGELKSPNGMVSIKGETAYDPVNGNYQSVSAFLNIGFQLENLARGKNPFVMPEPIFSSPRNVDRLVHRVTRNYRHTAYGVSAMSAENHTRQIKIVNKTGEKQTVYVKLQPSGNGPWGRSKQYTIKDFEGDGWQLNQSGVLYAELLPDSDSDPHSILLNFSKPDPNNKGDIPVTISMGTSTGCAVTQAEFTLHDNWGNNTWHDWYDISLVNGFNYKIKVDAPYTDEQDPYTPGNPMRCLATIQAASQLGNSNNTGVFGLGNDQCCASCAPPPDCCPVWGDKIAGEAHPTYNNVAPNCPTGDPYGPCSNTNPKPVHGGAQRCDARPRCQMDAWHSQATGNVFTVTFGKAN